MTMVFLLGAAGAGRALDGRLVVLVRRYGSGLSQSLFSQGQVQPLALQVLQCGPPQSYLSPLERGQPLLQPQQPPLVQEGEGEQAARGRKLRQSACPEGWDAPREEWRRRVRWSCNPELGEDPRCQPGGAGQLAEMGQGQVCHQGLLLRPRGKPQIQG